MSGQTPDPHLVPFPSASLPPIPPARASLASIAELVRRSGRKVVVLDDDPTGTQTVHGVEVLTDWAEATLAAALRDERPCFYVLTNSRSLPEAEAVALTRTVARNLRAAAAATGQAYTLISRSDSTLRGHFPAEIGALLAVPAEQCDGVIVAPAFFEAGRATVDDIQYVREPAGWVPVAETEFARDATFGYRHSNLRQWIEEKTRGRVLAASVVSIPLEVVRSADGALRVCERLRAVAAGAFVIVNAAEYADLEVFVQGLLLAEASGKRFIGRTAASFVRVRAGLAPRPLLDAAPLDAGAGQGGGLVVVGSFTGKTTAQLERALARPRTVGVELNVGRLAEPEGQAGECARLAPAIESGLRAGTTVVLFTSRERETALGRAGDLAAGRAVSETLVSVVRALSVRPRFVIAKGGITSSDVAVRALGIRRALVLGQIEPGVPVWRTGAESRWPELTYIVFPGNVGEPDTLQRVLAKLGR